MFTSSHHESTRKNDADLCSYSEIPAKPEEIIHGPLMETEPESLTRKQCETPLFSLVETDERQEIEWSKTANVQNQFSLDFTDNVRSVGSNMVPASRVSCSATSGYDGAVSRDLSFGDCLFEDAEYPDVSFDIFSPNNLQQRWMGNEEASFGKNPMISGACPLSSSLECQESVSKVSNQFSSGFVDDVHLYQFVNDASTETNMMPSSSVNCSTTSWIDEACSGGLDLEDELSRDVADSFLYADQDEQMNCGDAHFPTERDSLKKLLDRVRTKYGNLRRELLSKEFLVLLDNAFASNVNLTKTPEAKDQEVKMIEQLRSFERILDSVETANALLQPCHRELTNAPTTCAPEDATNETVTKVSEVTRHSGSSPVRVPVTARIPADMETLNIKPRQISSTDKCTNTIYYTLSLLAADPTSGLDVSLSENCNPIQSTEDSLWPQCINSAECMKLMENLPPELRMLDQDAELMQELEQQLTKPPECTEDMDDLACYLMMPEQDPNHTDFFDELDRTNDTSSTQVDDTSVEAGIQFSLSSAQEQCHIFSSTTTEPEISKRGQVQEDFTKPPDAVLSKPVQETVLKPPVVYVVDAENLARMLGLGINSAKFDNVPLIPVQFESTENEGSNSSMHTPRAEEAESCINQLSLQPSLAAERPTQNTSSQLPQGLKLASQQPRAGKRATPFKDNESQDVAAKSAPLQAESNSTLIPISVEEMSNGVYKPNPKRPKKKS